MLFSNIKSRQEFELELAILFSEFITIMLPYSFW